MVSVDQSPWCIIDMGHAGGIVFVVDTAPVACVSLWSVKKMQGSTLAIAHWPVEKHLHAAEPASALGSGSTSPMQGPQVLFNSLPEHVVMPSLHMPTWRSARFPVQQGAVMPCIGHGQPGRFLSEGH